MSSLPTKPTGQSSYELMSATRFDGFLSTLGWNNDSDGPSPFFLLPYHLDRLRDAAERHGWAKAKHSLTYEIIRSACQAALASHDKQSSASNAFKIRITLAESGALAASVSPALSFTLDPTAGPFFNPTSDNASLFGPILTLYVDSQPTPSSLFTTTKTTQRDVYNSARSRVGLPLVPNPTAVTDVLLYNPDHFITETSIFNVAFFRSSQWVTPSASTGCLPGVLRRWLLEQGRVREDRNDTLTKDSVREGEWVLLFNGVQGCRLGRIAEANADLPTEH